VGGLFLAFIQPHIPALVWSASSVRLDAVVSVVGPWLLVMAAGTAIAAYGDPWRNAIPYVYRELGLVAAVVVWGLALIVAPALLAGQVNAGTLDAGLNRTVVDLSKVVAYLAWFAAMFFIGRQWGLLGLGAGAAVPCRWLNHVGYSTQENAIAIGWLGAGVYAANVEAQQEQRFTGGAAARSGAVGLLAGDPGADAGVLSSPVSRAGPRRPARKT
jgi:hypothetical protein